VFIDIRTALASGPRLPRRRRALVTTPPSAANNSTATGAPPSVRPTAAFGSTAPVLRDGSAFAEFLFVSAKDRPVRYRRDQRPGRRHDHRRLNGLRQRTTASGTVRLGGGGRAGRGVHRPRKRAPLACPGAAQIMHAAIDAGTPAPRSGMLVLYREHGRPREAGVARATIPYVLEAIGAMSAEVRRAARRGGAAARPGRRRLLRRRAGRAGCRRLDRRGPGADRHGRASLSVSERLFEVANATGATAGSARPPLAERPGTPPTTRSPTSSNSALPAQWPDTAGDRQVLKERKTAMRKRLIINGFSMNVVSHIYHGLWRRPDSRQVEFNSLDYWTDQIRICERGKFDNSSADVIGVDPIYKGWDTYVKEAVRIRATTLRARQRADRRPGTSASPSSSIMGPPVQLARVSTSTSAAAASAGTSSPASATTRRNFGFTGSCRTTNAWWAAEYVGVYKLWEGSMTMPSTPTGPELLRQTRTRSTASTTGQRYKVLGPHLDPSRSGRRCCSRRGLRPAGPSPLGMPRDVHRQHQSVWRTQAHRRVNRQVEASGRKAGDLKFIQGMSFVVGSTEDEAKRKARDLDELASLDGLLAHISRDLGIDLGLLDPDRPVEELEIEGVQGYIRYFEEAPPQGDRPGPRLRCPTIRASSARRSRSPTASRTGSTPASTESTSCTRPCPHLRGVRRPRDPGVAGARTQRGTRQHAARAHVPGQRPDAQRATPRAPYGALLPALLAATGT
jgi:hypothetical protein